LRITPLERDEQVLQALSKVSDIDSIILRPNLNAKNAAQELAVKDEPRIALLEHQQLEQMIKQAPADPLPYLQLAKLYHCQLRFKDTIRVLDAGVQHNSDHEPLIVLREDTVLDIARQQLDQARQAYANHPTKDNELRLQGCVTNFAHEEIRFCQSRFQRHPEQIELLVRWSSALLTLGNPEAATEKLEQAVNFPEWRAAASLLLGRCYHATGKLLQALSSYRRAACFRAPPPDENTRSQALIAGFELADQLQMVDTAIQFGDWLEAGPKTLPDRFKQRLIALKKTLEN
jgi:tetratricopeptide (TPR) repeat protein